MPWARQASSRVALSGTRTWTPSISTSTRRFGVSRNTEVTLNPLGVGADEAELDRGLNRGQRRLAEAADRRVAGDVADVGQQLKLGGDRTEWRAAGQPSYQLLLADGADPAGHALAAGLVAEEPGDPAQQGRHRHRVVEHEHHAGAKGGARRACPLVSQRQVQG